MSRRTVIKICGLMREEDVELCIRYGIDIIGFVTEYPVDVPWNMDRERTSELIAFFRRCTKKYGASSKCCIVSGGSADKLSELSYMLRPDYLQMHYQETAQDIRDVYLKVHGPGTEIIKTVPSDKKEMERQTGELLEAGSEISGCTDCFAGAGASILLVDARNSENAAAKSSAFDEDFFNKVREASKIPVMAAGGITPDNIVSIMERLHPDMIDIMTGVEEEYGVKSEEKIKKVTDEIKSHESHFEI